MVAYSKIQIQRVVDISVVKVTCRGWEKSSGRTSGIMILGGLGFLSSASLVSVTLLVLAIHIIDAPLPAAPL
jgi:hypothetical protein